MVERRHHFKQVVLLTALHVLWVRVGGNYCLAFSLIGPCARDPSVRSQERLSNVVLSASPTTEDDPVPTVPIDDESKKNDVSSSSCVCKDDGGSDLTDRFKYKVNALMGVFDPPPEQDTEQFSGHILNAMLTFPTRYTFHVVGRGNPNDFCQTVRHVIDRVTGGKEMDVQVIPRGTKFTKITLETEVCSADMITNIYEQIGAIKQTVMQF